MVKVFRSNCSNRATGCQMQQTIELIPRGKQLQLGILSRPCSRSGQHVRAKPLPPMPLSDSLSTAQAFPLHRLPCTHTAVMLRSSPLCINCSSSTKGLS